MYFRTKTAGTPAKKEPSPKLEETALFSYHITVLHSSHQCIKIDRMQKIAEPNAGTRIDPIVHVFKLVLISIPEKLVTTWK